MCRSMSANQCLRWGWHLHVEQTADRAVAGRTAGSTQQELDCLDAWQFSCGCMHYKLQSAVRLF